MDKKSRSIIIVLSVMLVVMFAAAASAIGYIVLSNQRAQEQPDTVVENTIVSEENALAEEGIPSMNTASVSIVIDGYEFLVPSDYSCMYMEDVGPVIYLSDVFQLRIIVKGRPFAELVESPDDLTDAATDAGASLLQEVTQTEIDGNSYLYFKMNLSGEDEIVCYADVPDHKTHLGGQIVVQSDAVSDEDLLHMFASIVATAQVTDKPNSTAEDIASQISVVFGTAKSSSSLTLEGTVVQYKVAAGYYSTAVFDDAFSATECFDGADTDVMVCLYKTEGEDAEYYAKTTASVNEDKGAELWEETVDGKTVYCCGYSYVYNEVTYHYIEAFCDVNQDIYYTVVLDSTGDNTLDFEKIRDFFVFPDDEAAWSPDSLKKGMVTVVECDEQYEAYIASEADAREAIVTYGVSQRARYSNPEVEKLELEMEKAYEILAVNLGEMDAETAADVNTAFAYMYRTYPQLQGTLTNLTIGNLNDFGNTAQTRTTEFILNGESGAYPFVVKREIILGAAKFLRRDRLLETCQEQVSIGYWPENSDISSIVVHELGHHLLDVYTAERFGFEGFYVTEEKGDAYWQFASDSLAVNQTVPQEVLQSAYQRWTQEYGHEGSFEDFQASISGYARGIQADGGISYTETVAEAIADVYLNGEQAADASKLIADIFRNEGTGQAAPSA